MTAPSPITPWNKHFTCDNGAQFYEAYRELEGWMQPGFDDAQWLAAIAVEPPPGALRARLHAPTRVIETVAPVKHDKRGAWGTGWHATNMFFELLAREDMVEEAHALMTHDQVPSLGAFIKAGCTTIPDNWHMPCSSNIHSVFIGAGSWFYEGYAGIQADPDRPGFERFVIRPQIPSSGLDWVEASYDSVRGTIRSAWRREGDGIVLQVAMPGNCTGAVHVPTRDWGNVTFDSPQQAGGTRPAGIHRERLVVELPPGRYCLCMAHRAKNNVI
jgi:alpha-L-rhamnosidase